MSGSASTEIVHIVGAGPGDPELLTIKAHRLITHWAQVVVYDRLIPKEIIELIPENVECIYAGKSCRQHVMTQDEINETLLEQARLGKKVLRLKGGDPFVFGRGGEEVEYLAKHGVESEVTGGISAASGISSLLGVPLTHRGMATSVRFITGHQQKGEAVELDWRGLADPQTTLVVYMGLSNIRNICNNLICAGLAEDTPAVAVENGTMESQIVCFTNLASLPEVIAERGLNPPTIVIIGKVVSLINDKYAN